MDIKIFGAWDFYHWGNGWDSVEQASVLNQCIIRMNYIDEVNKNYVLFFILKGNTPIATCEVTNLLEKKIGQFYADEHDRTNCLPTPEVRNAMLKYLDELKVS